MIALGPSALAVADGFMSGSWGFVPALFVLINLMVNTLFAMISWNKKDTVKA